MKRSLQRGGQAGFTVIELVVVIIIIIILIAIIMAGYSGVATRERNVERKNDIELLQEKLEYHYVKNNQYPSLQELNDKTWRGKNFRQFNQEILRDPSSDEYKIVSSEQAGAYAYKALTADGTACDNKTKPCTQYTLTTTYEGGSGEYTRTSRN